MSTNSINKIYVNGATRMSLNDRFSVIQSVLPTNMQSSNQTARRKSPAIGGRRKRSNSGNRGRINNVGIPKQASLANRKFLEQLEKKHKMQAALKLKRRSLKATMPPAFRRGPPFGQGQRTNNRFIGFGGGRTRRGTIAGKLLRSNSLANIATMKADLIPSPAAGRIQRSNSTSNLAARLGNFRRNSAQQNSRRLHIRGNNVNQQARGRSRSRQRNLSRSNSLTNLNRSNSRTNLQRSNSRNNINIFSNGAPRRGRSRSISRNRQNLNSAGIRGRSRGQVGGRGNSRFRSASQPRKNLRLNSSVHTRLGVKRLPINVNQINKRRLIQQKVGNNFRSGPRIAQGRILKRKNSTGVINNVNINSSGGRLGRSRGRGNSAPQGRSRSQSRGRNRSAQRGRAGPQRGNRRGARNSGRGISRASGSKEGIKKEDLDKELDQYMATTKTSDIEM